MIKVWRVSNSSLELEELDATRVTDNSVFFPTRRDDGKDDRQALRNQIYRIYTSRKQAVDYIRTNAESRIRTGEAKIAHYKKLLEEAGI